MTDVTLQIFRDHGSIVLYTSTLRVCRLSSGVLPFFSSFFFQVTATDDRCRQCSPLTEADGSPRTKYHRQRPSFLTASGFETCCKDDKCRTTDPHTDGAVMRAGLEGHWRCESLPDGFLSGGINRNADQGERKTKKQKKQRARIKPGSGVNRCG